MRHALDKMHHAAHAAAGLAALSPHRPQSLRETVTDDGAGPVLRRFVREDLFVADDSAARRACSATGGRWRTRRDANSRPGDAAEQRANSPGSYRKEDRGLL